MKNKILEKKAIKWCNTYYECDDYIILNCLARSHPLEDLTVSLLLRDTLERGSKDFT